MENQCQISIGISVKSVLEAVSNQYWNQCQHGDFQSVGFLRKEALYYTVTKRDRHLRTPKKCRKHQPQVSLFYIS